MLWLCIMNISCAFFLVGLLVFTFCRPSPKARVSHKTKPSANFRLLGGRRRAIDAGGRADRGPVCRLPKKSRGINGTNARSRTSIGGGVGRPGCSRRRTSECSRKRLLAAARCKFGLLFVLFWEGPLVVRLSCVQDGRTAAGTSFPCRNVPDLSRPAPRGRLPCSRFLSQVPASAQTASFYSL